MYQALYRKWRPKVFSDVVGQAHISQTLRRQVAENRVSHAYLFTGTRGTGKTTCAKILAKAVNCEQPINGDPCCACPACLGIESGNFLDVLELDAASNNGVEQIRALREESVYTPAHVKKRVYIVDEVHMLSLAAFNALLKILEEPPEHLIFILATTELQKVPATILSRCQRFAFRRISSQDIAERLRMIAEQEQISLTSDGAELLSRLANGALRDGLSLLDQCAAAGGIVDSALVLDILGLAGNLQTAQLMDLILQRDTAAVLKLCGQLYDNGKDMGAVLGELSTLVRDLLLWHTTAESGESLLSGGYDSELLNQLGKKTTITRLLSMAATLQKTTADLLYSTNRRIDTELCLLCLCNEIFSDGLTALTARLERLEEQIAQIPTSTSLKQPEPSRPELLSSKSATSAKSKRPKITASAPAQTESLLDFPPWEEEPPPEFQSQSPDDFNLPPWEEIPPLPPSSDDHSDLQMKSETIQPPVSAIPDTPAIPTDQSSNLSSEPSDLKTQKVSEKNPGKNWWREFVNRCKSQIPKMYGPFLDVCTGVLSGDLLTVYAADDWTLNRLDNPRVREVFLTEAEQITGMPIRLAFQAGEPPQAQVSTEENFQNLVQLGGTLDDIVEIL